MEAIFELWRRGREHVPDVDLDRSADGRRALGSSLDHRTHSDSHIDKTVAPTVLTPSEIAPSESPHDRHVRKQELIPRNLVLAQVPPLPARTARLACSPDQS